MMTTDKEAEAALDEADRMRIIASEMKQLGFKRVANWLNKNADKAMMWAAKRTRDAGRNRR